MRILHVNKFFDLHGGADVYFYQLMRRQEEAGHEVHALSTRSPNNLPSKDAARFVRRYDYARSEGLILDARKAVNYLWNREAKRAMEGALTELKPDVVHLHNVYHHLSTSILAPIKRIGVPCVQTLHDLKLACPNYRMYTEGAPCERCKGGRYYEAIKHHCVSSSLMPNMLAALEMGFTKSRQAYESTVHTFICPSEFMASKMVDWGEPSSKFKVARMPVVLPELPAGRGGGYLLAVGRLSPEKGYDMLIRAAARVPKVKIKIAGIGPEEDRLLSLAANQKATNIEFVGLRRGDELYNLYRYAEGFVACPVGYENAPLSVLDALAYGLPVLAADVGGLPEMVDDDESGYLVERDNVDAWVRALQRFASLTESQRWHMAAASRRLAETKYPRWEKHLMDLEEIYSPIS